MLWLYCLSLLQIVGVDCVYFIQKNELDRRNRKLTIKAFNESFSSRVIINENCNYSVSVGQIVGLLIMCLGLSVWVLSVSLNWVSVLRLCVSLINDISPDLIVRPLVTILCSLVARSTTTKRLPNPKIWQPQLKFVHTHTHTHTHAHHDTRAYMCTCKQTQTNFII